VKDGEETNNKAWAYIHRELDDGARAEFELAMQKDVSLARLVEEVKQADREFARLLPLSEQSPDVLEEKILEAWESSQAPKQKQHAPVVLPSWGFGANSGWVLLAACLILGMGIHWFAGGPLEWKSQNLATVYRGEGSSPYSDEELTRLGEQVRDQLVLEYRTLTPRRLSVLPVPKSVWAWNVQVSPTTDRAILLEVAIYDDVDQPPVHIWQETFTDLEAAAAGLKDWANLIILESTRIKKME
jgi:hypothetical protein